jgi:hypothetical protein
VIETVDAGETPRHVRVTQTFAWLMLTAFLADADVAGLALGDSTGGYSIYALPLITAILVLAVSFRRGAALSLATARGAMTLVFSVFLMLPALVLLVLFVYAIA